jgi:hypothetical protein
MLYHIYITYIYTIVQSRIDELRAQLEAKKSELQQALLVAKGELNRDRHTSRRLLKVARHIEE